MSNKLFTLLIAAILSAFLGWMFYDSQISSQALRGEGVRRDVLGQGAETAAIQYIFHFPDTLYNHTMGTKQIEALAQGGGENYHVYGLTQANYKMDALYQVNSSKKWFKSEYTMWVDNLQVDFSYTKINVYVTSHYPEGSCEYQHTLAHENQHVEIHRQVYEQYKKVLREALANTKTLPLYGQPIVTTSWEEGKERIGKMISAVTDPVFDQFKDALDKEQAIIDTPQEYDLLRQSCQNW